MASFFNHQEHAAEVLARASAVLAKAPIYPGFWLRDHLPAPALRRPVGGGWIWKKRNPFPFSVSRKTFNPTTHDRLEAINVQLQARGRKT